MTMRMPHISTRRSASPLTGASDACRDERGASILLALFYFLVCAVVGAVVLTAATVTTGQLVALEKSQQAYYSVSSAAELLRDSIVGGTCEPADTNGVWTCSLPAQTDTNADGQHRFESWLKSMVERVAGGTTGSATATSTFDFTFSSASDPVKESVLDVRVTAVMQPDYSLRFTLRPKNYTQAVGDYRVTMDIPAALLYGVDETTVERVTWERAIIGKPLQAEGGAGA